jgi:hypothetical protein
MKYTEFTNTEEAEKFTNQLILRKITKLKLQQGIHENSVLQMNYNQMTTLESSQKVLKSCNQYIFCTFNFDVEHQNIDSAMKFKDKLCSKKSMEKYSYTYEQRGECLEDIGKGLHMHFLIARGDKKPAEWTRELYNTFKPFTGFSLDDFKKHRMCCFISKDWAQDKIEYMSGKKWDQKKDLKCEMDVVFRQQNNLEILYNKDLVL